MKTPVIGITIGDINGIGIEVIMKTFSDKRALDLCTPVIYGSTKALSYHKKALNIEDFNFNSIRNAREAKAKQVNVINCWNEEVPINLGQADPIAGEYAYKALDFATEDLKTGQTDALVTAPIHKDVMRKSNFKYPGHTEFLTDKFNVEESLMLMISNNLRVGLVTSHIPLKDVAGKIRTELILKKIELMYASLEQDFGLKKPMIAVLGLNPHAGDGGSIGSEEQDIIIPAIEQAKKLGIYAFGPYAADGFFGSGASKKFDGILAMYHDQGLAPFKTIAFGTGVNFTAGLPVVRTSPDHGTAFEIAGKGEASPDSFRAAVFAAIDIVRSRQLYKEMTANPLKKSELTKEQG